MTAPRRGGRRQHRFTAEDLAPLRGATQLISRIPGGLRGLRPPATFFATLRVAEVSQLYSYPRKLRPGLNSDRCSAARRQTKSYGFASAGFAACGIANRFSSSGTLASIFS